MAQQNGLKMVAKGSVVLVEDFCCASPKRKEYKIDELLIKTNGSNAHGVGYTLSGGGEGCTTELITTTSPTKTRMVLRGTQNSVEATNGVGAAVGVPVTGAMPNGRLCPVAGNEITRFLLSQSKSKSRKARKKSPNFELVNDDTCDSFTHATTIQEQGAMTLGGVVKMEAEDDDCDNDEGGVEGGENENTHPFQMFGRMPIGTGLTDGANIFLQEPVLKLTVDEAACVLVQPKGEDADGEAEMLLHEKRVQGAAAAVALINQDSNSGDSGVVIDKLQDAAGAAAGASLVIVASNSVTPRPLLSVSRQRVPTTPHRILCPSSPQLTNGVKEEGMPCVEGSDMAGEDVDEDAGEDVEMTKRK